VIDIIGSLGGLASAVTLARRAPDLRESDGGRGVPSRLPGSARAYVLNAMSWVTQPPLM
jgi:hypothetical protein